MSVENKYLLINFIYILFRIHCTMARNDKLCIGYNKKNKENASM